MVAALAGLVGICLWLLLGFLYSARLLENRGSDFGIFVLLLCAGLALLTFWLARLVLALRDNRKPVLLILGLELALVIAYFAFFPGDRPLAYRVQANQVALEKAALSTPQGEFKTTRSIGSFPVRNMVRKKNTVWFECWDAMLGLEGLVYSPTPDIPDRRGFECSYRPLVGKWYLWYEDLF